MSITWHQFCKILAHRNEVAGTSSQKICVVANKHGNADDPHRLDATLWSKPVCIEHVVFDLAVDLSELIFESSLRIESCSFLRGVKLAHTRVGGLLSLRDSVFDDPINGWLDWRSLEVGKTFACTGIHSNVCLHLANARFQDDVLFNAATLQTSLTSPAVSEKFATNHTNWDDKELTKFLVGCAISMEGCSVEGSLYIDAQGTRRVIIHGWLDLRIRIKGTIQCSGVDLSIEDLDLAHGKAFVCDRAEIGGSLFFQPGGHDSKNKKYRFECMGQIDLRGNIGGQVNFLGVCVSVKNVSSAEGIAVSCSGAKIKGGVFFQHALAGHDLPNYQFECIGQINLQGQVDGNVEFFGALLTVKDVPTAYGKTINCMGATIGGSVFFEPGAANAIGSNYRFVSYGKIDLRCRVGGRVSFVGAMVSVAALDSARGVAIDFDGASILGSVFFQTGQRTMEVFDPFEAIGKIDLRCEIGNHISFAGARLSVRNLPDANGVAVTLEGAVVGGHAFFWHANNTKCKPFYFTTDGLINLRARFGDSVAFSAVTASAIDFHGARVTGEIMVGYAAQPKRCEFNGKFDLQYSCARSVSIHGCDFAATVDFSYAELANDLHCQGTNVFRSLLTLVHTIVNGNVTIGPKSYDGNTKMNGLDASHALVRGDFVAQHVGKASASLAAPWQLNFVRIEGNVQLNGSQISGDLILEDAIVDGEMNLSSTSIDGSLKMRSSKVAGRVFANETGSANNQPYPRVKQEVDLSFSTLSQVAISIDEQPGDYTPTDVILTGTVAESFSVRRNQPVSSQMTVATALFGSLRKPVKHQTQSESSQAKKPRFHVDGFSTKSVEFENFATLAQTRVTIKDHIRYLCTSSVIAVSMWLLGTPIWVAVVGGAAILAYMWVLAILNRRAENSATRDDQKLLAWLDLTEFDRGFYLDLEQLVRSEGDEGLADEIFLRRRRKEFELARPNKALFQGGWHWIWNYMLDLCLGYGVRTKRIWYIFLLMLLFNTAVFSDPRSVERPLTFVQQKEMATDPVAKLSSMPASSLSPDPTRTNANALPLQPSQPPTVPLLTNEAPENASAPDSSDSAVNKADTPPVPPVVDSTELPLDNQITSNDKESASTLPTNPTKPPVDADITPTWSDDGGSGPMEWSVVDGAFMALRVQLPLLPLIAESDWEPASREIFSTGIMRQRWLSYENYASIMIVINLILFPLLIAGATGIMKRLK